MIRKAKKIFNLALFFLFFLFSISYSQENQTFKILKNAPKNSIVDAVLFSINGTPYTLIDLKKYMFLSGSLNPKEACLNYIFYLLIEKKAKALGGKIPKEALDKAINEILKRNGMDLDTLKVLLETKNISFEDFKKFIELQLFVSSYIRNFGRPDIKSLGEEFNLEIYEPLCYVDALNEFYVPKYLKSLKVINNQSLENKTINLNKNSNESENLTQNENLNHTLNIKENLENKTEKHINENRTLDIENEQ